MRRRWCLLGEEEVCLREGCLLDEEEGVPTGWGGGGTCWVRRRGYLLGEEEGYLLGEEEVVPVG